MAEESNKLDPPELARLGARLHELRAKRGWTLDELAKRTALSKSYLSRLEDGDRQPSIASMLSLARTFEISLASLFETQQDTETCVIVRAGAIAPQQGNGLAYTPLSGSTRNVSMQPVRVTVSATRSGEELYEHAGEEWLYVLSGTLQLTLGDTIQVLEPGDAAHFDARVPHRLTALHGKDAELILVACAAPRQLLGSYL